MSEYDLGVQIDAILDTALANDAALSEDVLAVDTAATVQRLVPGHSLTPEKALAGAALRRGEIDVPEYARRIGQTPEQVREHFLKCGLTEDGQVPEGGLNMATFDPEYVGRTTYGRFVGDAGPDGD